MKKKIKKSGFLTSDLPMPQNALVPKPEFSQLVGNDTNRRVSAFRQEPALQHCLSVEGRRRRRGIKLSALYADYPCVPQVAADALQSLNIQSTMPSMTNYSNKEAPTPMLPQDRPI